MVEGNRAGHNPSELERSGTDGQQEGQLVAGHHHFMRLPQGDSAYIPSAELSAWRYEVAAVLSAHQDNTISFVSEGSLCDNWTALSSYHMLSHDILSHLHDWRAFLAQLFAERARLEFWTTAAVTDSWCEVMLCCHRVLHGDPLAQIGFTAWQRGFVPLAGVCELRVAAGLERKSTWQQAASTYVWQAPKSWSIQMVPMALLRHELVRRGVDHLVAPGASSWVQAASPQPVGFLGGGHYNAAGLRWIQTLLDQALQSRSNAGKSDRWQGWLKEHTQEPFWDKAQREPPVIAHEGSSSAGEAAQRHGYVQELIYSWHRSFMLGGAPGQSCRDSASAELDHGLLWQGWAYDTSSAQMRVVQGLRLRKILVDVASLFAPLKLILYWLAHDIPVVFISLSRNHLSRRIEILRHSLGEMFAKDEVVRIMGQLSFICVSSAEYEQIVAMAMQPASASFLVSLRKDGSLRVRSALGRRDYLRLAGNEFGADLGVGESQGAPVSSDALWSAQVLSCDMDGYGSVWLKAHFLKLLCQEAWAIKGGLPAVLKQLAGLGWCVDEDEKDWALFVTSQSDVFIWGTGDREQSQSWRLEDDFPWGMPWHQVLAWSKRYGLYHQDDANKPRYRVQALLGEHFLLFALLLAAMMVHEGWMSTFERADAFVRLVLGVPQRYGSLLFKFEMMSEVMIKEYAAAEWPYLKAEAAISRWFERTHDRL